ncbi:hypothetical protein ACVILI_001714 [Mesorhizobium sp. USDA 4775]
MKGFNLSDWALSHRSMVWYFMLVFVVAGIFSYLNLGREEDPNFTIKTMIIQANWPGASVKETVQQVTDRIEKKLEELDSLDYTKSVTTAGQTVIFVNLKDTTKARDVVPNWLQVRNMVNDIKAQFPQGVQGPFFNDRFGDVYGNIYAFTSDGLTPRQLRDYVEDVRTKILTVPNAGKVDLVGAQDEAIYLEFSTRQIAALGLNQQAIVASLQAQNAITPSGVIQSGPERISVRVGGQFASEDSLRAINLRVNDRFFRLSDVATITRGYADPPTALFRFNGQDAIGLAIGMKPNANLLQFGEALHEEMNKVLADLPVGVGVHLVADQPVIVEEAVSGFTRALFEAVAIVLAVSFISLGMRAGFVVALSIPLVLAITFTVMAYLGISLQRISLGALIIALGLLVDDAMIAVEMMVARLEVGDNLRKAATYVYTSTAFPMLTGTLVTVAGFIPIGLNSSAAGEYTFTLFVVIAVSLLVSWIVAVLFAPLLGVTILPATMKTKHHDQPGRFTSLFRRVLVGSVRHHWLTIIATVLLFAASIAGFGLVQQQFFPPSDRPELIVDWNLPQNSSVAETRDQMERFEQRALVGNPDIDHFSSYIGQGAVRFVLAYDVQPANPYFGPDRDRHQEHRGPQPGQAGAGKAAARGICRHRRLRQAARARPACRPSGAIPRRRSRHPGGARAGATIRRCDLGPFETGGPHLRLERAATRAEGRRAAGQGAPARHHLFRYRQRAQQHGRRRHHHAGARRHLSHQCRGALTRCRTRLDRDAAEHAVADQHRRGDPARGGGQFPLRARAANGLAARPHSDDHRARRTGRRRAACHRGQRAEAIGRCLHRQAAAGLFGRDRRLGRGKRQEPGADRGRGAADAFRHGHDPDDPVAELPAPVPGGGGGAARADRRGRGPGAERRAARLRRHPGRAGADWHPDPQLGHPDRADRGPRRRRKGPLGGRHRGDGTPDAADRADRGRRQPGADPNRARSVLGTDGLRDDGRHHRGYGDHAAVPAGALCDVVPDQGAEAIEPSWTQRSLA